MFSGINTVALDAKGRMALPKRCREKLRSCCDGKVVTTISAGGERCLALYPWPEWDRLAGQLRQMSNLRPEVRRLHRVLIGHAVDGELDASGRLLLPPPLREYAGLEKKVAVLGMLGKIEIWNEANLEEERAESLSRDLAAEVAELEGADGISI